MLTRTKPQDELGTGRCLKKAPKEAFRMKGSWWNAEQNKNINSKSQTEEGQRKSPKMNQTGKEPYENHSEKNRAYKMLKRTTKPLRRRVQTEEGLAKSSKKQHSENTCKWHLCKAGRCFFYTVNHHGPLPLKELHSTGETTVWRDPGGSWACLPLCVKSHCHRLWYICELLPKSTLRREKH